MISRTLNDLLEIVNEENIKFFKENLNVYIPMFSNKEQQQSLECLINGKKAEAFGLIMK